MNEKVRVEVCFLIVETGMKKLYLISRLPSLAISNHYQIFIRN